MKSIILHTGLALIAAGVIAIIIELFLPAHEYWAVSFVILFGLILCLLSYYWRYIAPKIPIERVQQDIYPNKYISVKLSNPDILSTQADIHQQLFVTNTLCFYSKLYFDVTINLSGSVFNDNKKIGELIYKNITINKRGKAEIIGWNFVRYLEKLEKIIEIPEDPDISTKRKFLKITGVDTHNRKYCWYI